MRLPRGLLSLLETKSLGRNPASFESELRLSLEMLDFYLPPPEFITDNTNGVNIVASADVGDVVVPNDEMWVVRAVGGACTGVVGGGVNGHVNLVILSGTTLAMALNETTLPNIAVGQTFRRGTPLGSPLFAHPGTTFRLRAEPVNGTASFSNTILFHRLRV